MNNYRKSKWEFETSEGFGVGFGAAAMSAGMVSLIDPHKTRHHFHYGGLGVGVSAGLSLSRIEIPKDRISAINDAPSSFPSSGYVYMTSAFKGSELSRAELCGPAAYAELGGNVVVGYGGTIMFLGLSQLLMVAGAVVPPLHLVGLAIDQAPAILIMRGANVSGAVGVSVNALLGMFH